MHTCITQELSEAELRRAIASYVALQAEHSAALRDQWAELLPDLELPPPPAAFSRRSRSRFETSSPVASSRRGTQKSSSSPST